MPGIPKQKPPNAFSWFARYVADQHRLAGRPFRSTKAAINEAALQWDVLNSDEKREWKEKARTERGRFRTDPELRSMTAKEFISQACEISTNGMAANPTFWSRHWSTDEREQFGEELDMLEKFEDKKRPKDRENLESNWSWTYAEDRDALLGVPFMLISVQSSSPVEAENYVPETLAFTQFSVNEGNLNYSEFNCALNPGDELTAMRRGNIECSVGDEDGCQSRVNMHALAKLIFQRVTIDDPVARAPKFFCLAEEFEAVYDLLCGLNARLSQKTAAEQRRLSVTYLATIEDLAQCLLKWQNIELPKDLAGESQIQLRFDALMERSDKRLVAKLRCGAHESDTLRRCPLSVVRLAATKIKEWSDNRGIPDKDLPLIERQSSRQNEWPSFSEHDDVSDDEDEDGDDTVEINVNDRQRAAVVEADKPRVPVGKHAMTWAWVQSQGNTLSTPVQAETDKSVGKVSPKLDNGPSTSEFRGQVEAPIDEYFNRQEGTPIAEHFKIQGQELMMPLENDIQANVQSEIDTRRDIQVGIGNRREAARFGLATHYNSLAGTGTELEPEIQDRLPFGARGIGRGMHLVPAFVNEFNALKKFLNE